MNEAQRIANYKNLSEREELERQIQREKEAQKTNNFRQWVKKQEMLEEKERLLKLLEQRDLINIRGREETEKKIDA